MTKQSNTLINKSLEQSENKIFFKQWLRSPGKLGTFAPISLKLAYCAAAQIDTSSNPLVVEIGAGTGRLSRALLAKGVNPSRLAMVELDAKLSDFLKSSMSESYQGHVSANIINGDARDLKNLIPSDWVGKVDYVVSAVPLMYMSEELREQIIQSALDVLHPLHGNILHVTYSPISPLRFMESELLAKRVVSLWGNMPPGFVWKFMPKRYLHQLSA
jgi:phosphatidylethanolamine/phosphatidyl-N-methylethanolamine N-methyltransferase